MISELKMSDFNRCQHLINKDGHMEVEAVILGNNPGRIFVDNPESPDAALLWLGNNDGFFLLGNGKNVVFRKQLDHFIEKNISPEAKMQGLNDLEIIAHHPEWNPVIENIFKHRKLESWRQRVYQLSQANYRADKEPIMDHQYQMMKIDKELHENNAIENMEFLHSNLSEFWTSSSRFFEIGIGYCMVYDHQIVSICFSGFVANKHQCINIETVEGHQGQKLAQKAAHLFVQECFEKNEIPYWDCMVENSPSVAVAEKLGFTKKFEYKGYQFPIG
ncbi:GNAT family N-acetyltransferase [Gracilibacillus lacisalsi]|uniref:GNAT family N-acetyltransferase n=1 Tax=Gracilibacillus lacisalsi TaxID=393087 RepID=UPI0003644357|nr:GNAT family N-acetyltransferase [Gracilibacillus lacisalsi]